MPKKVTVSPHFRTTSSGNRTHVRGQVRNPPKPTKPKSSTRKKK